MIRKVVVLDGTPQRQLLGRRMEEANVAVLMCGTADEAAMLLAKHAFSLAFAPWDEHGIELIDTCRKQGVNDPVVLLVTDEPAASERLIDQQLSRIESARQAGALGALPSSALGHPFIALFLKGLAAMARYSEITQSSKPTTMEMVSDTQLRSICGSRKLAGDAQQIALGKYLGHLDALPHGRRLLSLVVFMANGHPETADPVIGVINDLTFVALSDFYAEIPVPAARPTVVTSAA